jgi:hypothetical protein
MASHGRDVVDKLRHLSITAQTANQRIQLDTPRDAYLVNG